MSLVTSNFILVIDAFEMMSIIDLDKCTEIVLRSPQDTISCVYDYESIDIISDDDLPDTVIIDNNRIKLNAIRKRTILKDIMRYIIGLLLTDKDENVYFINQDIISEMIHKHLSDWELVVNVINPSINTNEEG